MSDQHIGQLLDSLGVMADLDENDLIVEAIVILKVIPPDSNQHPSIVLTTSEGLDWISQGGLLRAAENVYDIQSLMLSNDEDDDE